MIDRIVELMLKKKYDTNMNININMYININRHINVNINMNKFGMKELKEERAKKKRHRNIVPPR